VLAESCERFLFVHQGHVLEFRNLDAMIADSKARAYLGALATAEASAAAVGC